ncbi:MAG TPA: hypothetical protein VHB25_16550 [Gemmatimonadaceae bacterium]|nr:hypothetical protein [Gemmatimonadaceae bacterium]
MTRHAVSYVAAAAAGAALAGCHRAAATLTPQTSGVSTIANVGFNQPENLVYDAASDVYLVSNMGPGQPAARDDNGFISRVSPDGKVLALRWIAGGVNGATLDAPKGLAIRGDTLAVADVGAVHYFDRRTGSPLGSETLPGLVMNDLAFASDGSLWITDTGPDRGTTPIDTSKDMDAVWRIPRGGRVQAIARGLGLDRPDGIVFDGTGALVATFGSDKLERVGAGTSRNSWVTVTTLPGDSVDGLRRAPDGSLIATSWQAQSVWKLGEGYARTPLLTNVTSPAGVAIDTRRHRLAITSMKDNMLYLLPLH